MFIGVNSLATRKCNGKILTSVQDRVPMSHRDESHEALSDHRPRYMVVAPMYIGAQNSAYGTANVNPHPQKVGICYNGTVF